MSVKRLCFVIFIALTFTVRSEDGYAVLAYKNLEDVLVYPASGDNSNLLLGNPSGASKLRGDNFLCINLYYTLSYNAYKGIPNWVSWHLDRCCLGKVKRGHKFYRNKALPDSFYQVGPKDYLHSGFDKGHNCPSADRTNSSSANKATFLMTNITPQAPFHNQVTWSSLEQYIRKMLVRENKEAYIICGSYGTGGSNRQLKRVHTLCNKNITVPSHFWKIVLILDSGSGDLKRITSQTQIIAVDIPNINTLDKDWRTYQTDVSMIECATGYRFFDALDDSIRQALICNK